MVPLLTIQRAAPKNDVSDSKIFPPSNFIKLPALKPLLSPNKVTFLIVYHGVEIDVPLLESSPSGLT
ncbi:MAG: hypothetical protein IPM96_20415 [Ignavibacteria bacterium]|nr:hypothetical protein [Ignavibacteria bacterium]